MAPFGKGTFRSEFQRRRRLRVQAADDSKNNASSAYLSQRPGWLDFVGANALPTATSLALVGLATIGLVFVTGGAPLNLIPLVYMLPVIFAARRWGIVQGLVAAFAGAAATDFFFYPPRYSLWLDNREGVIDLLLYVVAAVATSGLAARLTNEGRASTRREREITELCALSRGLAACLTCRDLISAVQDYLSTTLKYRAVLIASAPDDTRSDTETMEVPDRVRGEAAKLIATSTSDSSIIMEAPSRRAWLVRTIVPEILGRRAIAIALDDVLPNKMDHVVRRLEAVLQGATLSLKHLKITEAVGPATLKYQNEVLRDALIGGISHELRTPLVSILGSCSVLNELPAVMNDSESHALVDAINDQATRLDSEIRELLKASRIRANGVRPQMTWADPTDIVAAAVKQKSHRLSEHSIVLDLQEDTPLIHVDPVLIEQALGQLLENAAKFSPLGSKIKITSRCAKDCLDLSVTDSGIGLTAEEKNELGKRCYRNARSASVPGSGLGLWVASTFVAANGGSLLAESRGPNLGSTISLRLPIVPKGTPKFPDAVND